MLNNPIPDLESLISYLQMNDEEKALDLLYTNEWYIQKYTDAVADTIEDLSVPEHLRKEILNADTEEHLSSQVSDEALKAIADHVKSHDVLEMIFQIDPAQAPTWATVRLLSKEVEDGWLVHASDNAGDIAASGFEYGVCDLERLALTKGLSNFDTCSPGYNFAFEPGSFERHGLRWGDPKYGNGIVVFEAPYVLTWHDGDNEPQAIFWGPDAKNIQRVWVIGGEYIITVEDDEGYGKDVSFDSLEELLDYIEDELLDP